MKKILFIIVVSLITQSISAQIQRRFFNSELGISTKEEVRKNLEVKGYEVINKDPNTISIFKPFFAGDYWIYAIFEFMDNIFYAVRFGDGDSELTDRNIPFRWESLKGPLNIKYEDYKSIFHDDTNHLSFFDNITYLSADYAIEDGKNMIFLNYIDVSLKEKLKKNEEDEL